MTEILGSLFERDIAQVDQPPDTWGHGMPTL